jgi:hypothetical protein
LRATIVAGIGGLIIGHIVWLVAISLAIATKHVNFWVLIVAGGIAVASAVAFSASWRLHQRKSYIWSTFLWCLPVSPILLTLAVLGVTYL